MGVGLGDGLGLGLGDGDGLGLGDGDGLGLGDGDGDGLGLGDGDGLGLGLGDGLGDAVGVAAQVVGSVKVTEVVKVPPTLLKSSRQFAVSEYSPALSVLPRAAAASL
jgi:hypothetical protein